MKKFMSVILAVVLVMAVGGSVARGTIAGLSDTEVSTGSYMCAGSRVLELSSSPLVVQCAIPDRYYYEDFTLINAGTLDGSLYIHIPKTDDPSGQWDGLKCFETGTVNGLVFNGTGYRTPVGSEPVGSGVATTEPELVAEQGGYVGEKADGTPVYVTGLGIDKCNICDYIDVNIYFEDELKVSGKLSEIACTQWLLGVIPASPSYTWGKGGGGWGSYFTYHIGTETQVLPMMAGKTVTVGSVTVWNDATNLYVSYNITAAGYDMKETNVYVGTKPPDKLAPGSFPWKHENLTNATTDLYTIPLSGINGGVGPGQNIYIAAHAANRETYWAQGQLCKVRVELRFPDIPEDLLGYNLFDENIPAEAKWDHWPTNAYQGDGCIFDMVFGLNPTP